MMMTSCPSTMLFTHEAVHLDRLESPVQETGLGLTTSEIQEIMSLLQEGDPVTTSGSEGSSRAVDAVDERKRRRMTLNRESARRSRWRKKKHLEDLSNDVEKLKVINRELKNQLGAVAHKCHATWRENDCLVSESLVLRTRLSDLCRILSLAKQMESQGLINEKIN